MDQGRAVRETQDRELSLLHFCERVLEEADRACWPLAQQVRFVSLFSQNLDQFFAVRCAKLYRRKQKKPDRIAPLSGMTVAQQLSAIAEETRRLLRRRDGVLRELLSREAACGLEWAEVLFPEEKVRAYHLFQREIAPRIQSCTLDEYRGKQLPSGYYVCALLRWEDRERIVFFSRPPEMPAFFSLSLQRAVRTERLISLFADALFPEESVLETTEFSVIRTRHETLKLELTCGAERLAKRLPSLLQCVPEGVFFCRFLRSMAYYDELAAGLGEEVYHPAYPAFLSPADSIRSQIERQDLLLCYPYHSMQPFLDFLEQAVLDPQVSKIQITLYRLAAQSHVASALKRAAEAGKEVTIWIELRARFDEQANLAWAGRLRRWGCRVFYGPERAKCHAKLCLITGEGVRLLQVGTGNYHEGTARQYVDFSLFTADRELCDDAADFFAGLEAGAWEGSYRQLLVSPWGVQRGLLRLIAREGEKGAGGRIVLKCNALTDGKVIEELCRAARAGARVQLLVRGACCLLPGVPGKTEGITVQGTVGRFLEHARVFAFGEGEEDPLYLSSADLMPRSCKRRVEIACPVKDPVLQRFLREYLAAELQDRAGSRFLLPDGTFLPAEDGLSSQEARAGEPPCPLPLTVQKQWESDALTSYHQYNPIFPNGQS